VWYVKSVGAVESSRHTASFENPLYADAVDINTVQDDDTDNVNEPLYEMPDQDQSSSGYMDVAPGGDESEEDI